MSAGVDCHSLLHKGNQAWIFIGRTDAEAEAPIILWPPDANKTLWKKTPMLGKIESKRRRERQRMKWLDIITNSVDMHVSKLWEIVKDRGSSGVCSPWGHRVRHNLATKQQQHTCVCVSILPQTSLLSRLPRGIEQSSLCSTVDPCWLLLTLLLTGCFALVWI